MGTLTALPKKRGKDGIVNTASALLSPNNPLSCCYCQQQHSSGSCGVIIGMEERKQILVRAGRCFVCLQKYHISKQCRHGTQCQNCSGEHHSSICSRASEPPNHPMNPTPLNPQTNEYQPPVTTSMYTSTDMEVLLQTARGKIFHPEQP